MAPTLAEISPEVREQLTVEITSTIRSELELDYARKLDKARQELESANAAIMEEELEKIRKEMKPPSPEELDKLLSQEYKEFKVRVMTRVEGQPVERTFTLTELPQTTEKKFYETIKKNLIPHAKDIGALSFKLLDGKVEEKIISAMNTFDPLFTIMAEICALCLDPRGEAKDITPDWVSNNLSSQRIWNIIEAQIQVSRMRDFFSRVFLSLTSGKTESVLSSLR